MKNCMIATSKAAAVLMALLSVVQLFAQTFSPTIFADFNVLGGDAVPTSLNVSTDGKLYGTLTIGGSSCAFEIADYVFQLMDSKIVSTLYSFDLTWAFHPNFVFQANDGNLYVTTQCGGFGFGTLVRITPGVSPASESADPGTTNGGFPQTIIHFFNGGNGGQGDGFYPGPLVQATDGNIYGVTCGDGASNFGTIFKFDPNAMFHNSPYGMPIGSAVTTVYSFVPIDEFSPGQCPTSLIQASDGNFYGTTFGDGMTIQGSIFKLTPDGTFTNLYVLDNNPFGPTGYADGWGPTGLIQGLDGNLYGTTWGRPADCPVPASAAAINLNPGVGLSASSPESGDCGTIFKVTLQGEFTVIHTFADTYGSAPGSGVIQAQDGMFYGVAECGGSQVLLQPIDDTPSMLQRVGDFGVVFQMTPDGAFNVLYNFEGQADGWAPTLLLQNQHGVFYGTTSRGASNDSGTVFTFTISPPAIAENGIVNGASFQAGIVSNAWLSIFGTNLSSITDSWANAIVNGSLPTSLDGVSVIVGGEPAYISYISPTQINALAPNVGPGVVSVTVTNSSGASSPVTGIAQIAQPAFFQWGNYAVATHQDYSLAVKNGAISGVTTVPAAPGEVIILWGTAFGPTSPPAPVGSEVPSGVTYNTADRVTVTVGSTAATVYGAALSPGYAGLYQVAIQIPTSLADGDYPVIATVSGQSSPSTTLITVQN